MHFFGKVEPHQGRLLEKCILRCRKNLHFLLRWKWNQIQGSSAREKRRRMLRMFLEGRRLKSLMFRRSGKSREERRVLLVVVGRTTVWNGNIGGRHLYDIAT